jgi:hypothetical protein
MNGQKVLPKMLRGTVCAQWVRCGRKNCRCARGHRHGPLFYRFWQEGGKVRKQYVRRADLELVRAQCEARRQFRRELVASQQEFRQMKAFLEGLKQK